MPISKRSEGLLTPISPSGCLRVRTRWYRTLAADCTDAVQCGSPKLYLGVTNAIDISLNIQSKELKGRESWSLVRVGEGTGDFQKDAEPRT